MVPESISNSEQSILFNLQPLRGPLLREELVSAFEARGIVVSGQPNFSKGSHAEKLLNVSE